jgi:hypothetical protein
MKFPSIYGLYLGALYNLSVLTHNKNTLKAQLHFLIKLLT